MDLGLYWTVINRHRGVAIVGLVASLLVGAALVIQVGESGIKRRGAPTYQAEGTLLVTQSGFPLGRSTFDDQRFSDPSRFAYLATLYATIASGDEVRQLVRRKFGLPPVAPKDEAPGTEPEFTARSGYAADSSPLPVVTIAGLGTTQRRAMTVANVAMESLRTVIRQRQDQARIAANSRVELQVTSTPRFAWVVKPNRPTTAVMVFFLGLMLTVVAAFVAEARDKRAGATASKPAGSLPGALPGATPESPAITQVTAVPAVVGDTNVERLDRPRSLKTLGEDDREGAVSERGRLRAPGPGG
jgi:capsular polysaccharide biosynthesis protein